MLGQSKALFLGIWFLSVSEIFRAAAGKCTALKRELIVGKSVDLRDALPYEDLGISHRGANNILTDNPFYRYFCVYEMGGAQTKQDEIISSSSTDFANALSVGAGIEVGMGAFKAAVTLAVRHSEDIHKKRFFAKKTVSIQIKSVNIRTDCLRHKKYLKQDFVDELLSLPRQDLSALPNFNHPQWSKYKSFLEHWGTAFISGAVEGGALEVTMSEAINATSETDDIAIKSTLSAAWKGLGSISADVKTILSKSQESRDGYFNLLISGGSKDARAALQHRFDTLTLSDVTQNNRPLNITAVWAQSVEECHAVTTKAKYITWDKFPLDVFPRGHAGCISKNFRTAIELYLKNAWATGCPIYAWNAYKLQCDTTGNVELLNRRVRMFSASGFCVEFDMESQRLVAKRKDCSMGLSIFYFHARGNVFSLELVQRGRVLGLLNDDQTMTLVPVSTLLVQNFAFTPNNHLFYGDEDSIDRKYANLNAEGIIEFQPDFPSRNSHQSQFYLQKFDGGGFISEFMTIGYGNPLTSEVDFIAFVESYSTKYGGPSFRITCPFWGQPRYMKSIENLKMYYRDAKAEDKDQLWRFRSVKTKPSKDVPIIVSFSNTEYPEKCFGRKLLQQNGVNVTVTFPAASCEDYQRVDWELVYHSHFEGSVQFRIPSKFLDLSQLNEQSDNSTATNPESLCIYRELPPWIVAKETDMFSLDLCNKAEPAIFRSFFKFNVILPF